MTAMQYRFSYAALLCMCVLPASLTAGDAAKIEVLQIASSTTPGGRIPFSVRIENTGTTTWRPVAPTPCRAMRSADACVALIGANKYGLIVFAYDVDNPGPPWVYETNMYLGVVPLPSALSPGETVVVDDFLTAPRKPGNYTLYIMMTHSERYNFLSAPLATQDQMFALCPRSQLTVTETDELITTEISIRQSLYRLLRQIASERGTSASAILSEFVENHRSELTREARR